MIREDLIESCQVVDSCVKRLADVVDKLNGVCVVLADHGNADDMYERDAKTGAVRMNAETGLKKARTAHSLNPVPFFVYDPAGAANLSFSGEHSLGVSSLASTCIRLLGFEPPEDYTPSIVSVGVSRSGAAARCERVMS